jgi:signal transduction histidine kinase
VADLQAEPSAQAWRSDHLAVAAAIAAVASPIAFLLFGWIAGAVFTATAAAISVVVVLTVRIERFELERRAHDAEAGLAAERNAKARFLSILSHDLRQPIHALSLYTAALRKRVETDEARGIVDKIDRAAQSSAELVTRVDDYARFVAATLTPMPETCALQAILDQVSASYPSVAIAKTELMVRTTPRLLRPAISRLADNAVRYGGGGRIELHEDGETVEIIVIDQGPGIALEDQERIFQEFVRLEGARHEGLGLGLPVARSLARALGDDVRVVSKPGEGARFSVRAPIAR